MSFTKATTGLLTAAFQRLEINTIGSIRYFSKFLSRSAGKRIPLTTKRAKKGFYKGKGSTKEGNLTSTARFVMDRSKMLELVIPDLTGFKVSQCLNDSPIVFL